MSYSPYTCTTNNNNSSVTVAAVSSDHTIKIYEYTETAAQLTYLHTLKGHKKTIHDIQFRNQHNSYIKPNQQLQQPLLLCSASEDGTAAIWDLRQANIATVCTHPRKKSVYSCAVQDHTLVTGVAEGLISIWDLRSAAKPIKTSDD